MRSRASLRMDGARNVGDWARPGWRRWAQSVAVSVMKMDFAMAGQKIRRMGGGWKAGLGLALAASVFVAVPAGWAELPSGGRHALDPADRLEGEVDTTKGELRLQFRGRPVLVYVFPEEGWKPYVRELHTLRGENLLRDAPEDHLHHHGLMYAVRVNGVNFWEEAGGRVGRQVGDGPPQLELGRSSEGLPQAMFRHRLRWEVPGAEGAPAQRLLRETREITVTVDPGQEEVALEWRGRFRVPRGMAEVRLEGADYNGLGIRLAAEFDRVAVFANGAGTSYSEEQTWDIRAGGWSSAQAMMGGREVMLVLGWPPDQAAGGRFFSMRQPFAYLTATSLLDKQPRVYQAGDRFEIRHRVLVYPAAQNAAFLGERMGQGW